MSLQIQGKTRELDEMSNLIRILQAQIEAWCKGDGGNKHLDDLQATQSFYKNKVKASYPRGVLREIDFCFVKDRP